MPPKKDGSVEVYGFESEEEAEEFALAERHKGWRTNIIKTPDRQHWGVEVWDPALDGDAR